MHYPVAHIHRLSYALPEPWDDAIDGWMTALIVAGTSPATRRTRRAHVRSVARGFSAAHPRDLTSADLRTVLESPECSTQHRRGLRASLVSFYKWCATKGIVDANPAADLPVIRAAAPAPRPATEEIWRQLWDSADRRTLLMARLAAEAGLRRAEVASVHTDDLVQSIAGPQLIVHGKGGNRRVIPIDPSLAAEITRTQPNVGYLFPGKINGHISPDRVGRLVSKVMPPGWSMHKLRHRFATGGFAGAGNAGVPPEAGDAASGPDSPGANN
jgi:integrase